VLFSLAALVKGRNQSIVVYRGTVKGKVVVLEPGAELPEGTRVHVQTEALGDSGSLPGSNDLFRMGELAVETGIPDLASNADHYLYGHPKVKNAG
jgi:hypothetical protein